MHRAVSRFVLPFALLFALAACTQPPPALSTVAGGSADLTSFVALVDALDIDLDALTQSGEFTVFAPSNDLLDAYASAWGFADAAAVLAALDTLTSLQTQAVVNFVAAHVVADFPGLLDEAFLAGLLDIDDWYWYAYPEYAAGDRSFTHVWSSDFGSGQDLELYFLGESEIGQALFVRLQGLDVLAADVPFRTGIVHVIDAEVVGSGFF